MGMQAHFSIRDLPENAKVQIVETMPADEEYPFALYDAVIIIPGDAIESFNYNQNTENHSKRTLQTCMLLLAPLWRLCANRVPICCS